MQARIVAFFVPTLLLFALGLTIVTALEIVDNETTTFVAQTTTEQRDFARDLSELDTSAELANTLIDAGSATGARWAVRDDTGQLISASRGIDDSGVSQGVDDASQDVPGRIWPSGQRTIAHVVEFPDDSGRTLLGVHATRALRDDVRSRLTTLVIAVLTGLAAIVAAAYPLARWALRPVDELNRTAEAFAAGDLAARAEIGRGAPELQRLADTFNDMAGTVGESMDRERAFVADASHHLGNLLTPLRLRIEALRRGTETRRAEQALAEVDRIEMVVERLIAVARAEDHNVQPLALDATAAVEGCVHTWSPLAEERDIALQLTARDHVFAWAVPGAIEEIVDLFLDNALKYGEHKPIEVEVLRGLDNVRIVVRDHGPGLSDEEAEMARGRFWRSPAHQNLPGSGLGLAVAEALADACGGEIALRSHPAGGLEANLVLRRVAEEHLEPVLEPDDTAPDNPEPDNPEPEGQEDYSVSLRKNASTSSMNFSGSSSASSSSASS